MDDWDDFLADLGELILKYRPTSVLEFGCGAFMAASKILGIDGRIRYLGIDIAPRRPQEFMRRHVDKDVTLIHTNLHGIKWMNGPFDFILIDAHDGSAEQYANDTRHQCWLANEMRPRIVAVDDCRIGEVASVAKRFFGEPTGKGKGVTGLWHWAM